MLTKVKLSYIKSIEDTEGKFGPQKKIVFVEELDQGNRTLSGWVPHTKFNDDDWVNGKTLELEVKQNGKFWNFKLPTKAHKKSAVSDDKLDRILNGIIECYKAIVALEKRIDSIAPLPTSTHKTIFTNPLDTHPAMEDPFL